MHSLSRTTPVVHLGITVVSLTLLFVPVSESAVMGGSTWGVYGPSKITLPRSGKKPVLFDGNLRLHFDGDEEDESGSGTMDCYDAEGQSILAVVPMTWTTSSKKASFTIAPDPEALADFLEGRVAEVVQEEAAITLVDVKCKGAVQKSGASMRHSIAARGTAVLGSGAPVKLKLKMKAKSDIR